MATVPTVTQRSILPSDTSLPYSDASAGYSSSQAINKALFNVGGQISDATDYLTAAMDKIQGEDDKREFRKLDTEYSDYLNKLTYGDGTADNPGFMNLKGENAINAYPKAQSQIQDKLKQLKGQASNRRVVDMFSVAADERTNSTTGNFLNYTADQRQKANDAVSDARVKQAVNDAASNWSDPKALERSIAIAQGEISDAAVRNGIPKEAAVEQSKEVINTILDKTVSAAIASNSTGAARTLLGKYSSQMDGYTVAILKDKIHSQDMQNLSEKERYENIAAKELDRKQEANFSTAVEAALLHQLPASELVNMLHTGELDAPRALRVKGLMDEETKVISDPKVNSQLTVDIYEGKVGSLEDVMDRAKDLSGTDRDQALALWVNESRNGGILHSYQADQGRLDVEAAVGGTKDPFGNYTDPNVATRVRKAYNFYNEQLTSGKSIPYAREQTILHYQPNLDTDIKTMARPLHWQGIWPPVVSNGDAFSKSIQDTAQQILQDNNLTPEEKAREAGFLTDLNNRLLQYQQNVVNSAGTQ